MKPSILIAIANGVIRGALVGPAKPQAKNKRKLEMPLRKKPLNLPPNLVVAGSKRRQLTKAPPTKRMQAVTARKHLEGLLAKGPPRTALPAPPLSTLQIFLLSIRMKRYVQLYLLLFILGQNLIYSAKGTFCCLQP